MLKAKLFTQHLERQREIREQARASGSSKAGTSPYVRSYNFARDPVETRTILRGEYRPETYNGWETYLNNQLPALSERVSDEIRIISESLPQSITDHTVLAIGEAIQIEQMPASAGSCTAILNP